MKNPCTKIALIAFGKTSVRFTMTAALLLAAMLLTGFPERAPGASTPSYFYNWSATPSITDTDPVGSPIPNTSGQDITKAWHAYDGTYHYFRVDLASAPSSPGNYADTYGIYLDTTTPDGAPAGNPYVPQTLSGIDYILSSKYELSQWDPELQRWTSKGFRDSEDLKFQAVMPGLNDGLALEWRIKDTSDGAKFIGDSFTWWAATMHPGEGDVKQTYDVTRSSVVPIPNAAWLLGAGLIALVGLKRRRPRT